MSKPDYISVADWNLVNQICNVNTQEPYLIGAIGWHETHWGLLGAGKIGFILGFGYWSGSTVKEKYRGLENQLKGAHDMIRSYFTFPVTQNSVDSFAVNHWRSSAPLSWSKSVYNIFLNISQGIYPKPTETEIVDYGKIITTVNNIDVRVLILENSLSLLKAIFKRLGEEIGNEH